MAIGSSLFNILQRLRAAKDFVVSTGPVALRAGADALAQLALAMKTAADYVERIGPLVQFTPGAGPDAEPFQAQMAEYDALRQECERELAKVPEAPPGGTQAGILDRSREISPEMRRLILQTILDIIARITAKSSSTTPAVSFPVTGGERRSGLGGDQRRRRGGKPEKDRTAAAPLPRFLFWTTR